MNLRQSILFRTDLNLDIGLAMAQAAHLSMALFRDAILKSDLVCDENECLLLTQDELEWLKNPYLFIHAVPNKEVLEYFMKQAQDAGIVVNRWYDTIYIDISNTQTKDFENVLVGITLGPCDSDRIRVIIGDLPLFKGKE
jgi:peptidyl-tRNA hydrolase